MNSTESRKVFTTACRVIQARMSAKRRWHFSSSAVAIFVALVVLLLGPNAQARKKPGDWRAVENLEPGRHVIVKAQHKYGCTVEGATEEELVCWAHQRRSFRMVSIRIPRAEIHEVRTLPDQAKDTWIGVWIGAIAGAVVIGIERGGAYAVLGGVAGAFPGAIVGAMVPAFQFLIQRGKIIYKQ